MTPLATFTTDFGLSDSYVAEMKGVLLRCCPDVSIADISHEIRACDVLHGGRVLAHAAAQFPEGTVHVAVVDPGVGSSRRGVVLEIELEGRRQFFVGPDNGLFSEALKAGSLKKAWRITGVPEEFRCHEATTFDGRDLFTPTAVLLFKGEDKGNFLEALNLKSLKLAELSLPQASVADDGTISGEIIYFDRFGNAATNIHRSLLSGSARSYRATAGGHQLGWASHYEEIPKSAAGLLFNSQGFVEVAACRQSAKDLLKLKLGVSCILVPS